MKSLFVLPFLLVPTIGAAQSHCNGQTQLDANFCAKEKWEIADRELNRLWSEKKPLADAAGIGAALLDEQRAWLRYRDLTCESELQAGGSADQMFYWSCMELETLRRNQVLSALR